VGVGFEGDDESESAFVGAEGADDFVAHRRQTDIALGIDDQLALQPQVIQCGLEQGVFRRSIAHRIGQFGRADRFIVPSGQNPQNLSFE